MDGWKDRKNRQMVRWTGKNGRMIGWKKIIYEKIYGWMDRKNRWMVGRKTNMKIKQMDGWMDKNI